MAGFVKGVSFILLFAPLSHCVRYVIQDFWQIFKKFSQKYLANNLGCLVLRFCRSVRMVMLCNLDCLVQQLSAVMIIL